MQSRTFSAWNNAWGVTFAARACVLACLTSGLLSCSSGKKRESDAGLQAPKELLTAVEGMVQLADGLRAALDSCRARHPTMLAPYDEQLHADLARLDTLQRPMQLSFGLLESAATDPRHLIHLEQREVLMLWRMVTASQDVLRHLLQLSSDLDSISRALAHDPAALTARRYGMVFEMDQGGYYIGQVVELGRPVCRPPDVEPCPVSQISGFETKIGAEGRWSRRPGKPGPGTPFTQIVVPLKPSERIEIGPGDGLPRRYTAAYHALEEACGSLVEVGRLAARAIRR